MALTGVREERCPENSMFHAWNSLDTWHHLLAQHSEWEVPPPTQTLDLLVSKDTEPPLFCDLRASSGERAPARLRRWPRPGTLPATHGSSAET